MHTVVSSAVKKLRLVPEGFRAAEAPVDELRAIPHIQYLRNFDQIEWSPALMGLDQIGHGGSSTLVCASPLALQWLEKITLLRSGPWDFALGQTSESVFSKELSENGRYLKASDAFTDNGGFVNCWEDENRLHFVWGWVDFSNAASILAFSWLQHVLAGGRMWQRRKLRMLSDSFTDALPIGYLSIDPKRNVRVKTFGVHRPVFERSDGKILGLRSWLNAPRRVSQAEVLTSDQAVRFYLPVDNLSKGSQLKDSTVGVCWTRSSKPAKRFLALYPSGFGAGVDSYQRTWEAWLSANIPNMEESFTTELLLCVREALINADKHGCNGALGKRVGLIMSHDNKRRSIRICVSDPGVGHKYNINAPVSQQDHELGKHLGLMLIHGLASSVRFFDQGSTIEFDFTY